MQEALDEEPSSYPLKVTKYISILIFYTYIFGCLVEVIIFIMELLIDSWGMIKFIYMSCRDSQKIKQEKIDNGESKKKT